MARTKRRSNAEEACIRYHTAKLLKAGVIERAKSSWSSQVVLVKKNGGTLHYCIDYRKLNSVTLKDSHLLPRIDDSFFRPLTWQAVIAK